MREALAVVMVVASGLLLVAQSVNLSSSAFLYRFADNLLLAGAVLGIVIASRTPPDHATEASRRARVGVSIVFAAVAVLGTLVHYRGVDVYPLAVGVVAGLSVAMLVATPRVDVARAPEPIPRLALVGFLALGIAGRYLAPGSMVQTWLLAPALVLVVPGLALTYALVPRSTGILERFFWAPALSLGTQIVSLLWLDRLGVVASLPVFVAVATSFTLMGLVAGSWRSPRSRARSSQ